ncbi:P-loop containing nucleoside triphosphate hydrolase protein [Amanita muscaria]
MWDGLTSGSDRIFVLGATNRPNDIDAAILRRMPKRFAIGLPNREQRLKILNLMLQDTELSPEFPVEQLADMTEGFSGSDLKELCRNAAMLLSKGQLEGFNPRLITLQDFFNSDGVSNLPGVIMEDDRSQLNTDGVE